MFSTKRKVCLVALVILLMTGASILMLTVLVCALDTSTTCNSIKTSISGAPIPIMLIGGIFMFIVGFTVYLWKLRPVDRSVSYS